MEKAQRREGVRLSHRGGHMCGPRVVGGDWMQSASGIAGKQDQNPEREERRTHRVVRRNDSTRAWSYWGVGDVEDSGRKACAAFIVALWPFCDTTQLNCELCTLSIIGVTLETRDVHA